MAVALEPGLAPFLSLRALEMEKEVALGLWFVRDNAGKVLSTAKGFRKCISITVIDLKDFKILSDSHLFLP